MISWILLAAAFGYGIFGLTLLVRQQPLVTSPTHQVPTSRLKVVAFIFVCAGLVAAAAALAGLMVESLGSDDRVWYLFGAAVLVPVFSLVGLQSKKSENAAG